MLLLISWYLVVSYRDESPISPPTQKESRFPSRDPELILSGASQPNILLIMSDQHNPHVMGCAGDPVVRTPNLDRLAAAGTRFSNTYCGSPLCGPSRMSFLTSRPCSEIGVWTNYCVLDSSEPTFASAWNAQGYETVLCGRMHFNGPDQRHGFSQRIMGDVFDGVPPAGARHGIFESVIPSNGQNANCITYAGPGSTAYLAYDHEVTNRALSFLEKRSDEKKRPLAMVVGYMLPHNPFICPPDLFDYYYDKVTVPEVDPDWLESLHPAVRGYREHRSYPDISPEQTRIARAAYYGLVEQMDTEIGRLLDHLEAKGAAQNTLVIYASDHGEGAGENGLWTKSNFYEASAKVPMLWRWPGRIAAGQCQDHVTSLLDVGTTLARLAGGGEPFGSGRDMSPLLTGQATPDWEDRAVSEMIGNLGDPPADMLRSGSYKLNRYEGFSEPELFDLSSDPGEVNDLGADPAMAAVRERLSEQLCRELKNRSPLPTREYLAKQQEKRLARATTATVEPDAAWVVPAGTNSFSPNWQQKSVLTENTL